MPLYGGSLALGRIFEVAEDELSRPSGRPVLISQYVGPSVWLGALYKMQVNEIMGYKG